MVPSRGRQIALRAAVVGDLLSAGARSTRHANEKPEVRLAPGEARARRLLTRQASALAFIVSNSCWVMAPFSSSSCACLI